MPKVNGKEFPYTAKGKRDAAKYAKKEKDSFSGVKAKKPVNKKSQAGDLSSERGVMRKAAASNRSNRKSSEGLPTGLVTVTHRDKKGKLKNSTVNRSYGSTMPSSNYYFTGKKKTASTSKLGPAKGKPQVKTVKPSKRTITAKKLKGY
jgi:hypothetical protein